MTQLLMEPPEALELLDWARRHGFGVWHLGAGAPKRPSVIVLFRQRGEWVDIAHVRGADRVETARLAADQSADIWRPRAVAWHYYGDVVKAIEALRDLSDDFALDSKPYEPLREGDPPPLWITDAELDAKKHYVPPSGYQEEP